MDLKVIFGLICCFQLVLCGSIKNPLPELAKLCKSRLYSPENGRIDELLEAKPGVFSATFKCNLGYRMVGERRITCKNGNWETRVPWCKSLCNFMKCSEGQKCKLERNSGNVTCVCKDIYECPFEYKPICGSDHTTYASKCIMGMNSCVKKTEVSMLSAGACPKGLFEDEGCSECPRIRICQALYKSQYAFLGKLKTLKEAGDGVYLTFKVIELYKISALKSDSKFITLFKKKQENDCNCLPFLPHGKAFVMGQASLDANGLAVNLFDEHTFVEKFYGHKQMSLCWLV